MNLTLNQTNLSAALGIVSRAVPSRSAVQILSNVLLKADGDNRLMIAATNRAVSITAWIGATVDHDGAITVPARLLTEFVNSLPKNGTIELDLAVRTQTLQLVCDKFTSNIKGIDHNYYPVLPTVPDGAESIRLDTSRISAVTFAASTDDNRPTLTGVYVAANDGNITMAATDGFRLSEAKLESDAEFAPVVIPSNALSDVARLKKGIEVDMAIGEQQAYFVTDDVEDVQRVEVVSELIEAQYPDYSRTVPKDYTTIATLNKVALLDATKVADLFARDNSHIVRYTFGGDAVAIAATSAEMGDSDNQISATVDGPPVEIALNAKYIIDMLSNGDFDDEITIELTQPTRPILVRGNSGYMHVVMPMHPPRG